MAKRVLVIDDEESVRDAFALALRLEGHEAITAAGGMEALEQVKSRSPDLIFLDLRMPQMDGVETLRRLRKLLPEVPVYIVTAYRREFMGPLKQAASEGLSFEIMDKPLTLAQIRTITRVALGGHETY